MLLHFMEVCTTTIAYILEKKKKNGAKIQKISKESLSNINAWKLLITQKLERMAKLYCLGSLLCKSQKLGGRRNILKIGEI